MDCDSLTAGEWFTGKVTKYTVAPFSISTLLELTITVPIVKHELRKLAMSCLKARFVKGAPMMLDRINVNLKIHLY